jgi:hypothetical protein
MGIPIIFLHSIEVLLIHPSYLEIMLHTLNKLLILILLISIKPIKKKIPKFGAEIFKNR